MQLPVMLGCAMLPHLHWAACRRAGHIWVQHSCEEGASLGLSTPGAPLQHMLPKSS